VTLGSRTTATPRYSWERFPARRYLAQLPQGRKTARVSELYRVRGGHLHFSPAGRDVTAYP